MKKLLLSLTATLGLAISSQAFAGFHIDPFLGYETGKSKTGSTEYDVTGLSYGARLGWGMLGFSFGGEVALSNLTVKSTPSSDFTGTDLGVFVGYEFPIMLRAYATYFASSTAKSSSSESTGSGGTRIGVGYTGLPFVTINLEMVSRAFDKSKTGGIESTIDTKVNTTMLSVSVPL